VNCVPLDRSASARRLAASVICPHYFDPLQFMLLAGEVRPHAGFGSCIIGQIHFLARWHQQWPESGSSFTYVIGFD